MKQILFLATLLNIIFCQIPLYKKQSFQEDLLSISGSIPQINPAFEFGTPAQKIELIQDTWVGETWINLVNSSYNLNASTSANYSTTQQTYNYSYGVGTVTGYPGTEVMSIPAINLKNLRIPLLFENNGTGRGISYNGSIGLANFKEYKNWLEIAVQNNLLADSSFAFDLRNGQQNSYFYAGSASFPIKSSQLSWLPVISKHWSIGNITGTIIEATTYPQSENSKQAVWDSGFPITFIGANAYEGFMKTDSISNLCICQCNQNYPDLTFNQENMNFSLIPQDYMLPLQGGYCVLSVDTNPETWVPFMVFGEAMFRNYFVAYDKANQKIGFSKLINFQKQLFLKRDSSRNIFEQQKFLQK